MDFMPPQQPVNEEMDRRYGDGEFGMSLDKSKIVCSEWSTGFDTRPNEFIKKAMGPVYRAAMLDQINEAHFEGTQMPQRRDCIIVPVHKPKMSRLPCGSLLKTRTPGKSLRGIGSR